MKLMYKGFLVGESSQPSEDDEWIHAEAQMLGEWLKPGKWLNFEVNSDAAVDNVMKALELAYEMYPEQAWHYHRFSDNTLLVRKLELYDV